MQKVNRTLIPGLNYSYYRPGKVVNVSLGEGQPITVLNNSPGGILAP